MKHNLTYDYTFMLKEYVGPNGSSISDLEKLNAKLKNTNKKFAQDYHEDYMAFHRLPDEKNEILEINKVARRLQKNFETLVVIGIGGSDLGARAVLRALTSQYHNQLPKSKRKGMQIYFIGDTTDPAPLKDLLEVIDLTKTAFHVVSKSGTTIETMSNFLYLREKLIKKVGKKNHAKHIVATTSPDSGVLIYIAKENNYTVLPHGVVGGRFSVLSSVGLLAIACSGVNIQKIIQGADDSRDWITTHNWKKNPAFTFAALQYLAFTKKDQNIAVLMPYEYTLDSFGKWFRQLWAESLGKNSKGQTPVASVGPTDQHSQLQLYQEGPDDKTITFIKATKHTQLKTPKVQTKGIEYFGDQKFSQILHQELEATSLSLMKDNKPNGLIEIPELNEYYLGQLIYFFELATAYSGELYSINAFNQPGVEQSKEYLHAQLGKSELKNIKKELTKLNKKIKRKIA